MKNILMTKWLFTGLLFVSLGVASATTLNPDTISKTPPPSPTQLNAVMDPLQAVQLNVQPYVPPTPINTAQTDAEINTIVQNAILQDSRLADTAIVVSTQDGVVTLTGTVQTQEQKDAAIQAAKGIGGVKEIKSIIFVQNP